MSLCAKRYSSASGIGRPNRNIPSNSLSKFKNVTNQPNPRPTVPVNPPVFPPWRPTDPGRWFLPPIVNNPEIISHTLDLEKRIISWTIRYTPKSNITTTTVTDPLIASNERVKCPPIASDPVLAIGYQFPYNKETEITKTLTISCENDPEAFAAFTHPGENGITLLTVPKNYTGKFAEDFFMDYFINGNYPNITLPPGFACMTNYPICLEGAAGNTMILRAVTITEERVQYNVDINGMPATLQSSRNGDDRVILDRSAPAFNFNAIPPELEESLGSLADAVDRISKKPPQEPSQPPAYPPQDGNATNDEETPICGFTPDVDFQDIMSLLMFNYSFFSEKILDLLFMRLWALCELILWMFWNIIPLCPAEWNTAYDLIKKVFSADFVAKDGACIPTFLDKFVRVTIDKVIAPATCCNFIELLKELAKALANPLAFIKAAILLQACIVYWLVCFLRLLRNLLAYILMFIAHWLLFAITYGAKIICAFIRDGVSGLKMAVTEANTAAIKEEIAIMEEEQKRKGNVAGP